MHVCIGFYAIKESLKLCLQIKRDVGACFFQIKVVKKIFNTETEKKGKITVVLEIVCSY